MKKILIPALLLLCAGLAWQTTRCKDARCLLLRDAELARQFAPAIPIFMDSSTSAHVLQAAPELQQNPAVSRLLDTLAQTGSRMRQSAPTPLSCAVVGNSQNLTQSRYGKRIDAHGYVFRLNSAPVHPYEQDVGSRTTHHIFSHFSSSHYNTRDEIRIRPYQPETFNLLIPVQADPKIPFGLIYKQKDYSAFAGFYAALAEALNNQDAPLTPLSRDDLTQLRNVPNVLAFTPDFLWYTNYVWFNPENKKQREIASSGFLAVILALHLCDSVDLFGFGPTPSGEWGYYFPKENITAAKHRPGYQEEFLEMLEAKGIVRIFRGTK
ncbi:MAG: glycosyltransferase family 29 protein [Rickettsiales bacterium]|nr:glycosyltransferase family 29 protein [Rickettsiales bacterium]